MSKVSVAEISGLSGETMNPLVRVQLRESEGISGLPASLAAGLPISIRGKEVRSRRT